ncbi:MAG: hypothetical protein QGF59_09575, partial [Pirellulaceae bacterium]|nr:hypothetical protein [Pirellulaceae bacterium]
MQHCYEVRACRLSYPELTAESGSLSMQLEINASARGRRNIGDSGLEDRLVSRVENETRWIERQRFAPQSAQSDFQSATAVHFGTELEADATLEIGDAVVLATR